MSSFLKSRTVATVVAAVGVALFVFGLFRAWELGTVATAAPETFWRRNLARPLTTTLLAVIVSSCSLLTPGTEVAHDWALTAIEDNTLTLSVAVGSGSCHQFKRLNVEETAAEIHITAVIAEDRGRSGFCTADLAFEIVDVVLEDPLGEKTLTGCAPGDRGLQNYFGDIDDGRTADDCAEIIDSW